MTKEHWEQIQQLVEDIEYSTTTIAEECNIDGIGRSELKNIDNYADTIYGICEEDYCDDSTDELPHGYEEIWPMLPDGHSLSVGDMNRLKEHIQAWKEGR